MNSLWRIALYEYQRNVFKKSFILVLLSVPFFIVFSIGLGMFIDRAQDDPAPIGYVDHSGILNPANFPPELASTWTSEYDRPVEIIAFENEVKARAALEANNIQAYYVLPADYYEARRIEQFYIEKPGENAEWQFYDFLQINIAASSPPEIAYRVAARMDVTVRSVDGQRVIPDDGAPFGVLMPMFIMLAFIFMIIMSSGYTMSAMADEKENRTMEVLITSISPNQLVAGKILGIVSIGLTVLSTWTLVVILGITVARHMGVDWFNNLNMDWRSVMTTISISIPTYALAISLMTAIGAMVTTTQEGQSVSGIFFILHFIPLYLSWAFIETPHSPWAVTLSLLPFTSLVTIGMRNLFSIVPTWQIFASFALQTIYTVGAMWLAGRALRLGMLRYGQRLAWRKLMRAND